MKIKVYQPLLWLGMVIIAVSLACGPTPAPPQPPATEPPATEPPVKSGAVDNLGDVEKAVIKIIAEGSWLEPEGWNVNVGHQGSGFIFDPSGLAVTNNHVVTGAALLKVYVGGSDKPRNARVLGVSECSDLAVIDIEGDGYPYLEWYDGEIKVGDEVYAAGYPKGNYTLTDGIVSVREAPGETSWSSVDYVIQHSAKINPGNSGGPLVTDSGKVVGVNYADISSSDQNFAISRDEARPIIDELKANKDVDSIGVNGITLYDYDYNGNPINGIWVRSVKPGSPADKARVQAGDIIYQLGGEVLARDGTMADYCDVIRTHGPGDTVDLTIIRYADGTILEGQLNGRQLEVTGVFGDTGGSSGGSSGGSTGGYTYVTYTDSTGTIQFDIPQEWSDIDDRVWTGTWYNVSFSAPSVTASPDLNGFRNWTQPGVFFAASDDFGQIGGFIQLLDSVKDWFTDCKFDSRNDYGAGGYEHPLYEGKYDLYKNCGGYDTTVMMLAVRPKADPTAYLILVEVHVLSEADIDALIHILETFKVIGNF